MRKIGKTNQFLSLEFIEGIAEYGRLRKHENRFV